MVEKTEEISGQAPLNLPQKKKKEVVVFDVFEAIRQVEHELEPLLTSWADQDDFTSKIVNLSRTLQEICSRDEDAALAVGMIEREGKYSIKHPIDTAVICEVTLKNQDMAPDVRCSVLSASLTMNIAMTQLQDQLYNQKDPLTEEQRLAVRQHPVEGEKILREMNVSDHVWLDGVLQHHESIEGKGYPQGLKEGDISLGAKVISLVDIYLAKVAGRGYRPPLAANKAMQGIFLNRGHLGGTSLSELLIKNLGIYPPGTLVRLRNSEIGIVTQRGTKVHLPTVYCIIQEDGTPVEKPFHRNCTQENFSIQETVSWQEIDQSKLNLATLWTPSLLYK